MKTSIAIHRLLGLTFLTFLLSSKTFAEQDGQKMILFIAGGPSHNYGAHEHYAGCRLLADAIQKGMPKVRCEIIKNGWPADDSILDSADSIVIYSDGGARHPANDHLDRLEPLMKKGVGFVCIHYGVEVPKGKPGDRFLEWLGGYFETHWSVNPHWKGDFKSFPKHPIARGVSPFQAQDEWYFHMRFRPEMQGVTPILSAVPPPSTMERPDGPHSGNPDVRKAVAKQEPQHTAWAFDRPGGGRSFGFTGGHFHWNWGQPDVLRVVSNGIAWTAGLDIPTDGIPVERHSLEKLQENQDEKVPPKFSPEEIKKTFNILTAAPVAATNDLAANDRDLRNPQNAIAGLTIHPELEVTLAASEPTLKSLTNLDIDDRGRIWVCEVVNYRKHNGERAEGDRILILEDIDRDGVTDTSKVFYQGREIDSAMGICVLGNKVIVSAAPYVWVFTDENGDDVPEKKEAVFTKTGQPQHDHSNHSFVFGPDGKLYWNFGNTGKGVFDAGGNPVLDRWGRPINDSGKPYRQGMAFRCNPDFSDMEVLGHNFRNNYELAVDSFGTIWQSDNDDDGNRATRFNYVMEFGNFGYTDELTGEGWQAERIGWEKEIPQRHWHLHDPGVTPTTLITGAGSPTGIMVYEGRLLPRVFWDQVIHCDAGPNVVRAYPVEAEGAGYSASIVNLVVGEKDKWFRPADVCVAPDGSLFISDWYDPGVGGHNMVDMERGRLFRVAPKGTRYSIPKFDYSTAEGAAEALKNPNHAVRYKAWIALHTMGSKAIPSLEKLYADADPRVRARALWLLGKLPSEGSDYVQKGMSDRDPNIRVVAVRLARQWKLPTKSFVSKMSEDDSPIVLRELAIALREDQSPEMPFLWAKLASRYDGKDRWYLEALGIGAIDRWQECFDAWQQGAGDQWKSPIGRQIAWRARSPRAAESLANLLLDPSLEELELERLLRGLDFQANEDKRKALELIAKKAAVETSDRMDRLAIEAALRLGSDVTQNQSLKQSVDRYLSRSGNNPSQLRIIKQLKIPGMVPKLIDWIAEWGATTESVQALDIILSQNGRAELNKLLTAENASDRAKAVSKALSLSNRKDLGSLFESILTAETVDTQLKIDASQGLARYPDGQKRLIALARSGKLPGEAKIVVGPSLRSSRDDEVRKNAEELFPKMKTSQAPLPPVSELAARKGNVEKGKSLFATTATCAQCHIVNKEGKNVGPDLSEIGSKLSREAMYVSILDPSAGISHNFETYVALHQGGDVVSGLLISQSGDDITIRDAKGIDRPLRKSELESFKKSTKSLMPENLQETMSEEGLVDLVEYLMSLRKK